MYESLTLQETDHSLLLILLAEKRETLDMNVFATWAGTVSCIGMDWLFDFLVDLKPNDTWESPDYYRPATNQQ